VDRHARPTAKTLVFLGQRDLDWREVRLGDLGELVAWLRLPQSGRDGRVALLPSSDHHCEIADRNAEAFIAAAP
jgi:integrase/recombinase XerD